MKWDKYVIIAVIGAIGFSIFNEAQQNAPIDFVQEPVAPNWAAIAAWPSVEAEAVEAQPALKMSIDCHENLS